MNILSIFRFHFVNLFKKKNILIVIAFLLIYCLSSFLIYEDAPTNNILASVYFVFYAPIIPILDLFRALLLITVFILLFNDFMQTELRDRSSYILLRIKNTKLLFHSLLSSIMLFTVVFIMIGYVIALLLALIFYKGDMPQTELFLFDINWQLLFQQYLLLILSIILLLFINHMIVLLFKNIEVATLIILILFIGSFYAILFNPNQYIYTPFLYGFFNFQPSIEDRAFLLEFTILGISNITLYTLSYFIFQRKKDLFS